MFFDAQNSTNVRFLSTQISTLATDPGWVGYCCLNFIYIIKKLIYTTWLVLRLRGFMPKEKESTGEEPDESIYDEEGRTDLVEDDEMHPHEEGFMQGYEAADEEGSEGKEKEQEEESEEIE